MPMSIKSLSCFDYTLTRSMTDHKNILYSHFSYEYNQLFKNNHGKCFVFTCEKELVNKKNFKV